METFRCFPLRFVFRRWETHRPFQALVSTFGKTHYTGSLPAAIVRNRNPVILRVCNGTVFSGKFTRF